MPVETFTVTNEVDEILGADDQDTIVTIPQAKLSGDTILGGGGERGRSN